MQNIRYIKFFTSQGTGYGCFLIDWERDASLNYKLGMSFCNPKDNFKKSIARKIASGRINCEKAITGRLLSNNTGFITEEDFTAILNQIIQRTELVQTEKYYVPNWAKKALFGQKFEFGLRQINKITEKKLPQKNTFDANYAKLLQNRLKGSWPKLVEKITTEIKPNTLKEQMFK